MLQLAPKYDVTDFLDDHPDGADLIIEYGGKDVTKMMRDEVSHFHMEVAYEVLEEYLIGFVATEAVLDAAAQSNARIASFRYAPVIKV